MANNTPRDIFDFEKAVAKGMLAYAKKKGWKVKKGSPEPAFVKGKGEVYMHTDDAVIFGTIGGELGMPKGKSFAPNYPQDMQLFSGRYSKARVKKYIEQGKQSITQIDKQLPRSKQIIEKIKKAKKNQINYALIKGKKGIQTIKGDPRSAKRPKGIVMWTGSKQGVTSWVKKHGTATQKKNILKSKIKKRKK